MTPAADLRQPCLVTSFERAARTHIASRGSDSTKESYTADLVRWLALCEERSCNPDAPTLEDAVAFFSALKKEGLADQTMRRMLSSLSSMYAAADLFNPFKATRLKRPDADEVILTKEYTGDEARNILAAAEAEGGVIGARDLAVLQILYDTGMRISSVMSIRRDQVHAREDGQYVIRGVKVKKKGRVEVELPTSSVTTLKRWLAVAPESKHVFPALRGGGPLSRRAINQRMVLYGARAGVKDAAPHRFRATYITEARDAGVPLSEIQAAVHHSSPAVTQRYDRGVRGTGVASAVAKFRERRK